MADKLEFCSREFIKELYSAAMEVMGGGIYVKSSAHPCGWDFIDFRYPFDCADDLETVKLEGVYFSDSYDDTHPYAGRTLKEVLLDVGEDGWCFERGTQPWCG